MERTPRWKDPQFAAQMDRERRRSRILGRTIVTVGIAILLIFGIWLMATTPKNVPDDVYVEDVYRP
jgi:hypothetical protein